uniref:Melanocortin 2 receptor accessory protein n=1 Tax=Gopherus agassizii TaxID=38772 RepID=A0A452ITL1_9SAUR
MAIKTNSSEYYWSYEYYWDYLDPVPVDERKLKANKYSIVIAFWVGLAAFVVFLFLILLYMSRSGSTPVNYKYHTVLPKQSTFIHMAEPLRRQHNTYKKQHKFLHTPTIYMHKHTQNHPPCTVSLVGQHPFQPFGKV